MKTDLLVIGGGASGLMAACQAARSLAAAGRGATVTLLEKMPRPARKVMITGKGRCNFTNVKDWNDFSAHVRAGVQSLKSAWYSFTSEDALRFFEDCGVPVVVERGDRAFPASHHAGDIVDALTGACTRAGVRIVTGCRVASVKAAPGGGFHVHTEDGTVWTCRALVLATGGLSYPATGSSGDGYTFAQALGHSLVPTFPSLTALVPRGYKLSSGPAGSLPRHIPRETPLSELGSRLCGIQLKNVGVQLSVEGNEVQNEFGDLDFTDGGIEGPIGFQVSRRGVKALQGGARVVLTLDLKPHVPEAELSARILRIREELKHDPRSLRLPEKAQVKVLLGKLLPRPLIQPFLSMNPCIRPSGLGGGALDAAALVRALKGWRFDLEGYVGYERAVVTAGGVDVRDLVPKTLASKRAPGLFLCGELLDIDADTGGYNLQCAFSTGALAGRSAAAFLER